MALFGGGAARARFFLGLALAYCAYTYHDLRRAERPSFGGSPFFEDTDDGARRGAWGGGVS